MMRSEGNLGKRKAVTISLALLGALQPTPLPVAGIHKFYLGHYGWGLGYLVLGMTPLPRIACMAEILWYLVHTSWGARPWLPDRATQPAAAVVEMAEGLREIERLRQEGLISDYEFEQKRRGLLDRMP